MPCLVPTRTAPHPRLSIRPAAPTARMDPADPMPKMEPAEPMLRMLPELPMLRMEPALARPSTLRTLNGLRKLNTDQVVRRIAPMRRARPARARV